MSVELFVSVGEAIDKLTILDIKRRFIKDEKKLIYVNLEWSQLYNTLKMYIDRCQYQYNLLIEANESLWILQDRIRSQESISQDDCRQILDQNDVRCRIKEHINHIFGSPLREQKGYDKVTGLVKKFDITNLDEIKSFSYKNDETHIVGGDPSYFKDFPSILCVEAPTYSEYTNLF